MPKTIIEKINAKSPSTRTIKKAARIIKSGGLVIYPTETCYGLAADATNARAVRKVFTVKDRPTGKPLPIIVSSARMMEKYGKMTRLVRALAGKFMPGPLTIVTDKKKTVPKILNPDSIAFRISSHKIASKLALAAAGPITATSANISGRQPIYDAKNLIKVFDSRVDMILDCGKLKKVKPSTYVDARSGKILRRGAIPSAKIVNFIERATKR